MLRYVGKRYLQYQGDKSYYIKMGADSPEDFLGYHEFDGTYSAKDVGLERTGEANTAPLHRYAPHLRDWKTGDPTWGDGRGKAIIGAINYLADQGVNSSYFLTMNVGGDGQDVWPWTSHTERFRFDCSKLDQWATLFDHMHTRGIALHVVLSETENESLLEIEEQAGVNGFAEARKLYYREMVARFGRFNLVWNIGEENGWDDSKKGNEPSRRANTNKQRKAFASFLRELDPYDHPIVVHTLPGRYDEIYQPLLGHAGYDGPSLQMANVHNTHAETIKWIDRSDEAGRPWFVCLDEIGPASDGVKPDADDPRHDEVRHHGLWGNLMAGGAGVEWYFGYKYAHNDLDCEDFRSRANMWKQTRIAVDFFQEYLPFSEMNHGDHWITEGTGYCFAKPGFVYVVYRPSSEMKILLPAADYSLHWYNPRDGGRLIEGWRNKLTKPTSVRLGTPPSDLNRDWVALIRLHDDPPATIPTPPAPVGD
jgi:hypothetical protein